DSEPAGVMPHGAFDQVIGPKRLAHLPGRSTLALDLERGRARDHAKAVRAQTSQLGDEVLGEPLGKVLAVIRDAKILEGKDRDASGCRITPGLSAREKAATDSADESIAAARQRFDEARIVGRVPERGAQPLHG